LRRRNLYAATLLSEYVLALSAAENGTLEFESSLSEALGELADDLLSARAVQEQKKAAKDSIH
jgi:hypothetical protein